MFEKKSEGFVSKRDGSLHQPPPLPLSLTHNLSLSPLTHLLPQPQHQPPYPLDNNTIGTNCRLMRLSERQKETQMPFFCIETIISVKGICFKRESVGTGRAMGGARRAMGVGTRRTGRGNRKVRRRENTAKGMCRISGEREGISTVTTTVHRMKGREAAGGAGGTISASPQRREKRPKTTNRRKS
jgi:hypothetical protein